MPRSTREYLLRFADQAINDYDRALQKLHQMTEIYADQKPEHTKAINLIAEQTIKIQIILQDFRRNAM